MGDELSSPAQEDAFGALLFQRKKGRWPYAFWMVLLGGGAAFFGLALSKGNLAVPGVLSGLCLLIAGLCLRGFLRGDMILSFHQKGVTRSHAGRVDRLPYESVQSLSYSMTRQYVNGAYTGTSLVLRLVPGPDLEMKPFAFSGRHSEKLVGGGFFKSGHFEGNDELDGLRDHISGIIASRMLERVAAGETVPWYGKVSLLREGFQSGSNSYRWDDIEKINLEKGVFSVKVKGKFLNALSTMAGTPNFYAGFIALNVLHKEARGGVEGKA